MKRSLLVVVLALAVCALFLVRTQPTQAWVNNRGQKDVAVEARSSGPINLDSASVMLDQGNTILKYSVTNTTDQRITMLRFEYKIFDANGKLNGGGNWVERVNIPARSPLHRWSSLSNKIEPSDRVVLILLNDAENTVSQTTQSSQSSSSETQYVNAKVRGATRSSSAGALQASLACGTNFCNECYASASSNCKSLGVQSVSCSVGTETCKCEYSCK